MKLKEKFKNNLNNFKANTSRFKPLSFDEWLKDNGLLENAENRAKYTRYKLELDEKNKLQDKNLSRFIGSALFLVVFLVIFCVLCANSVGATDVFDNLTYNYSTGIAVDDINGSYLSDNIYQIQRFAPESGVDFTFIYSYATDYDALSGSGIQSYIYGVKNFESFYQYLARFNYVVDDMYDYLISNYNYFEMDLIIIDLIQGSIPDWLQQIDDTRTAGYNQGKTDGYNEGYDVGYDNGESVGYDNGFTEGETAGLNAGETLKKGIFAIFDAPVQMLQQILNFEIMGINLYSIFTFIITLCLLAILTKTIFGLFN